MGCDACRFRVVRIRGASGYQLTRTCEHRFFSAYCKVLYKSHGLCAVFPLFGQAPIQDRLIFKTGLCTEVVQLLAAYTVQSMHVGIQHPCVLYMTSHTIHTIKYRNYKPRLMCRHAVAKVRLLFKSSFYSRAASIQGRLLYNTLRYLHCTSCSTVVYEKVHNA